MTGLVGPGGAGRSLDDFQMRANTARGEVVIAPASTSQDLVVSVLGGADHKTIPPSNWTSQSGLLPQVGEECLVVFDDAGDAWVTLWDTSGRTPQTIIDSSGNGTADWAVVKEAPINVQWAEYGAKADWNGSTGTDNTAGFNRAVAALPPGGGGQLYIPRGAYLLNGGCALTGQMGVEICGDGIGTVLHSPATATDTLSLVNCDGVTVRDISVQNAGGRDALHLNNCQSAEIERVFSYGAGRYGVYAIGCVSIRVDGCPLGRVITSPFPTGVGPAKTPLFLDSGCNAFTVLGGEQIAGQNVGWAIQLISCEGGLIAGINPELSMGGIYASGCTELVVASYYGEANPSDVEYSTGTVAVTSGSTAVTGTGTAWTNSMVGQWLVTPIGAGMAFGRVLSVNSATSLTLASAWGGATASGALYRLVGVDLMLDSGTTDCDVLGARGGGAVLLRNASRNRIAGVVDSILIDGQSVFNEFRGSVNRANTGAARVVDQGTSSRIRAYDWQTNSLVRDDWAYGPKAAVLGQYAALGAVRQPSATRPVLCVASVGAGSSGGATQTIEALCDSANPPTTIVGYFSSTTAGEIGTITFVVPPGNYYKLAQTAGATGSLFNVAEYTL